VFCVYESWRADPRKRVIQVCSWPAGSDGYRAKTWRTGAATQ
jgi:hypothetical protein